MARLSSASSPPVIATCTASFEGFETSAGTKGRLALLRESAARAVKRGASLVCFPGGFLFSRTEAGITELQKQVEKTSKELSVILAVGVDAAKKSITRAEEKEVLDDPLNKLVREYGLPWFAVCAYPDGTSDLWRQRSINNKNQCEAPDNLCSESRHVQGLKPQAEILMCGEIFNKRIRSAIISRGTEVVVDLGHYSGGFRVHAAMKVLASQGVTCLCSVHADKRNAIKYCYVPQLSGYKARSTPGSDFTVGHEPRVEMKLWELADLRPS